MRWPVLLRRFVDLLFPPDPGALRLLAALRATLAALAAFVLVVLFGEFAEVPVSDRILGFVVALFITANVRDSTLHQRLVTIALAPFLAFFTTSLAAFLLDLDVAAAAVVPLMMFAISYGATRGPRYGTIGIVALIAYFIGLVTRQPPDTLPLRFVVLLLAAGAAALVRCVLLPERPQDELRRLQRAMRAATNHVLRQIAVAVEAGGWTDRSRAELHRNIDRLGQVVMLAQDRVAVLGSQLPEQGSLWLHLLAVELGVERVARVALRDLGTAAERGELVAMLNALETDAALPPQRSASPLAVILTLFGQLVQEVPHAVPTPAAAAPPPTTTAPGIRPAVQTAIAATLAIFGGELVSPSRWYWAAFAAYVMFQGTRSRGESVAKGVKFMIGTVAGVVIGMLLATLLSGHDVLTLTAIIVGVFLAFQANVAAFAVMVFWITIILGLLFGMLGYFPPEFLLLRLKETAAGAVCGALVASLVLVRREYAATYDATIAFLRALGLSVRSAGRALLDGQPAPDLSAHILAAEQRFRDLSAMARSEQSSHPLTRNEVLRRRVLLLEACEAWARELGQICLQPVTLNDPLLSRTIRQAMASIQASVDALIDVLAKQGSAPVVDDSTEDLSQPLEDSRDQRAVHLLLRIDNALLHLAERRGLAYTGSVSSA